VVPAHVNEKLLANTGDSFVQSKELLEFVLQGFVLVLRAHFAELLRRRVEKCRNCKELRSYIPLLFCI
jgi:hypothetical protein